MVVIRFYISDMLSRWAPWRQNVSDHCTLEPLAHTFDAVAKPCFSILDKQVLQLNGDANEDNIEKNHLSFSTPYLPRRDVLLMQAGQNKPF